MCDSSFFLLCSFLSFFQVVVHYARDCTCTCTCTQHRAKFSHPVLTLAISLEPYLVTGGDAQSPCYAGLKVGQPSLPHGLRVCLQEAGAGWGHDLEAEPPLLVFGHLHCADPKVLRHHNQLLDREITEDY